MKFRSRMTLLFVFIATFLITAPIVVLYTAGYRFSFDNNRIVRTGLLYATTLPKGADIIIDGDQRGKTPGFVKNLIPREYQITLSKAGYHNWQKTLPVNSHETTFVEDVTLYLEADPEMIISTNIVSSVVNPTQTKVAYLSSSASWLELWTYDISTADQFLLYRFSENNLTDIELTWSADGQRLLIKQTIGSTTTYSIIDQTGGKTLELSSIAQATILDAWWHPNDSLAVFYTTTEGAYVYRLATQTVNQIYQEPRLATLMEGQAILIDTSGSTVSVFRYVNDSATLLAYLPSGHYSLLPAADPLIMLKENNHDQVVLIDTSRDSQPILLNVDAIDAQWASDGSGRLLYFNNFEVHVYDPASHSDTLLTRVGESITAIAWHPDGNSVLVVRADTIEAIELDGRNQRNVFELAHGNNIQTIWVNQNGREAYFVGEVSPDRGLFGLELQGR
ncbi:MAG: PEGA domain-containing protein [Candidatus Uhrbacteria bacterium]